MAVDVHLAGEDASRAGVLSRDISMERLTIVQSGYGISLPVQVHRLEYQRTVLHSRTEILCAPAQGDPLQTVVEKIGPLTAVVLPTLDVDQRADPTTSATAALQRTEPRLGCKPLKIQLVSLSAHAIKGSGL